VRIDRNMTLLQDIAATMVQDTPVPVPVAERELQRLHVLDTVVAGLSAAATPEAAAMRPLLAGGTAADLAGLCSATARLSEIDDIYLPSCITPSAVAVPVALVIAANAPSASTASFLQAIRAGTGLVMQFGAAVDGARLLYRGIWPTYLAAPLGACATAARLFNLDRDATAHALSLALMLSSGAIGRLAEGRTGRWFLFACAVASGVRAAEAARDGMLGDPALLDGDWMERTRGIKFDPAPLRTDWIGTVYRSLSQKPYCTGRQCLAAGQAFRELIEEGLDPAQASAIRVRVPPIYAGMISVKPDPQSRSSSLIGAPLQMAIAALQPDAAYLIDRSGLQSDAALRRYAERVTVIPDEAMQDMYPRQWPGEVEVDTPKGTLVRRVVDAKGDPSHRLMEAELIDKSHRVLDRLLGPTEVARWIDMTSRALSGDLKLRHLGQTFVDALAASSKVEPAVAASAVH
jgi:2-methylcitrate dehydratase PrpD